MESREHIVSVGNIVLGIYVFIVLRLPPEWKTLRGEIPSEVTYSKEREGTRWVTEGQAHHYLHNRFTGSSLQLTIRCDMRRARRKVPRSLDKAGEGTLLLSGHPCDYVWGTLRGGLLRRQDLTYLRLLFACDRTERTVTFELRGRALQDEVRALTEALGESQCHTV